MTPKQVIRYFGKGHAQISAKVRAAADTLNVSPALIFHWLKEDRIPLGRQALIQYESKGELLMETRGRKRNNQGDRK